MQPKVIALIAAFAATVPLAHWMTGNIGTACVTDGPCLLPVGFGLGAPSGALAIGGILSAMFAAPALIFASVLAFVLAELADLASYAPLRKHSLMLAVFLSGVAGSIIDSAVFLWFAFGSLEFILSQVVGKAWMSLLVLAFLPFKQRAVK